MKRPRRAIAPATFASQLAQRVIGQPAALASIVPYINQHLTGLSPEGRPVGVFLLLGPSGTGKTRTAEAIAEVLHGSDKNVLTINCGEFQMEHEVAKLIGAPPGYLGHRDTPPLLGQEKLDAIRSAASPITVVLFDEIEKAAQSFTPLLLSILDKATLTLGNNKTVNFEKCLILLTSNLGSRAMVDSLSPAYGIKTPAQPRDAGADSKNLESIGTRAAAKRFSPEFMNRIDAVLTYAPLDAAMIAGILDIHLLEMQRHLNKKLGQRSFTLETNTAARAWLTAKGTSVEFGARELKRTIQRSILQPLSTMLAAEQITRGCTVRVDMALVGDGLRIRAITPRTRAAAAF
ncbi:MAG: hypothetical protein NVS9B4_00460 [Candidatus Acidiferrum sp.]